MPVGEKFAFRRSTSGIVVRTREVDDRRDHGAVTQTNNQSSTTNQAINQTSGGGIVIGGGAQNAQNDSNTNLNNCQIVGFAASASCATYARPCACAGLTLGTEQVNATTARKAKKARKARRSRRAITRILTVGG